MFKNTRMLAEAGIMVGLALALWYLNLGQLPQGGSISLQMLPLLVFALRWGAGPGIVVGVAYGFLHSLQDMFVVHPLQYLLDYPIAFGLVGLAGLVKNWHVGRIVSIILAVAILLGGVGLYTYTMQNTADLKLQVNKLEQEKATATPGTLPDLESQISDLKSKAQLFPVGGYVVLISSIIAFAAILYGSWKRTYATPVELGVLIGGCGRFVAHLLSGYFFFGYYAPEGMNPWFYSMVYNFLVVVPSTLLSLAVILMIWPSLEKASNVHPD
jgi:thiamine transporter ThiT